MVRQTIASLTLAVGSDLDVRAQTEETAWMRALGQEGL